MIRLLYMVAIACAIYVGPACAGDRKTEVYRTALRNWAVAACLSEIAKDKVDKDDADLSAYAYAEMGALWIEDQEAILRFVKKVAAEKHGGSVPGEYNAKKCIDLFYNLDLTQLIAEQTRKKLDPK